jgi:hypothetical protein
MKSFFEVMTIAATAASATSILMSPTVATGEDIAIVWIHGMDCDNHAYQSVAAKV